MPKSWLWSDRDQTAEDVRSGSGRARARGLTRKRVLWDHVAFAAFVVGLLFFAFLIGVLVAEFKLPPYGVVRDASLAGRSLFRQRQMQAETFPKYLWFPAVHHEKGLVRHEPSRASPGYTLYTSGHAAIAILLDTEGREVHRWDVPFSRAWPQANHVSGAIPDEHIYIRRAQVFGNGDLLALYETPMESPSGYGLAKLDRDGQILWTYDANAHHDFCVETDGTIYTLTHRIRTYPLVGWEQIQMPVMEEFIAIVSPQGEELKTISLFEALRDSPYYRPLVTFSDQFGDVIHSNTIHLIGEQFAAKHEALSAGDLMVCFRNLNLVVVINPDRGSIVWAATGPWQLPHDPDPLENGRIMIFDNCFARGDQSGSRVIELDPVDGAIYWEYAGNPREPFRSDVRSCQEVLPNGNVLIAESDYGRIFEVTRRGGIVWEYINPVRGGDRQEFIPIVGGVTRYTSEELPFLNE